MIAWWEVYCLVFGCMAVGFLIGAALFYPLGRRHGIEALAEHWRTYNREAVQEMLRKGRSQ